MPIRKQILFFVGTLILLSLLSSTISVYRISEVSQSLDAMNQVSIPLGKLLAQMQSDGEIFYRELERRLGYSHWHDPHWKPRPMPQWIQDLLEQETRKANEFVHRELPWTEPDTQSHWKEWIHKLSTDYGSLKLQGEKLYAVLDQKDELQASQLYPKWIESLESWRSGLQWGVQEYEKVLRRNFSQAESKVSQLRTGLEVVLGVVILLSLVLFWLGERALRPLRELTLLARQIAERGLRKEDKTNLPSFFISREDEVSKLAQEFHHMATALLEREKVVEAQKHRLEEQNRLLKEMGELSKLAAIGKMSAQVAHEIRNPLHSIGLEAEMALEMVTPLKNHELKHSLQSILNGVERLEKITENYLKLSKLSVGKKTEANLAIILEKILAAYSPDCENQKVKVNWSLQGNSRFIVWGDEDLLELVFGNLLKNSLQALENRSEPQVSLTLGSLETGRVWFRIEDNGPGVDPQVVEKLFQPFVSTKAQGTGLGLSFVMRVLLEHGGGIEYTQSKKQGGACFEVFLPAYDCEVKNEVTQHPPCG